MNDVTLRVLRAVGVGMDSPVGLAVALNESADAVERAVADLLAAGLLARSGADATGVLVLTPAGADLARTVPAAAPTTTGGFRFVSTSSVHLSTSTSPTVGKGVDLSDVVAHAWSAAQSARSEETARRAATLLVGDRERDSALRALSGAFGEGRLTQEEHDRRVGVVLHAKTRADLDSVFSDLPDSSAAGVREEGWHRTAAAVVAILSIPLFVLGVMLVSGLAPGGAPLGIMLLGVLVLAMVLLVRSARRARPGAAGTHGTV